MQRLLRIYPLLASFYPVLHLAASNTGEWVQLADLQRPLLISAGVTAGMWIVAALLTPDQDKRSLLAFLGVLLFIGGRAGDGVRVRLGSITPGTAALLLALIGFCAVAGTVYSRRSFAPATHFLGLMCAMLVGFPVVQLGLVRSGGIKTAHATIPVAAEARSGAFESRPTIYLIVLDKYQGMESLRSYYGFDNSSFERALRERGFVVPRRARANYTYTRQAMTSLLNWEYLDSLVSLLGEDARDLTPLFERAENNQAMAFLKARGYEIVFFPNYYVPFRSNRNADMQLPDPGRIQPEFQTVWQRTTLLVPLFDALCAVTDCREIPYSPESTSLIDWKFAQLGPLAVSTRPRFVLAHLLVPHEPYIYRADCSHAPTWEFWPDSSMAHTAYLAQLTCINQKVLAAVDAILRTSRTPPVILLQSDHGNGHLPRDDLKLKDVSPAMVQARIDVFAAYYLPGAPDTLFYDGMTPVNLLPRVFNHLFGTGFPRQPDRSFWVEKPYKSPPIPPTYADQP